MAQDQSYDLGTILVRASVRKAFDYLCIGKAWAALVLLTDPSLVTIVFEEAENKNAIYWLRPWGGGRGSQGWGGGRILKAICGGEDGTSTIRAGDELALASGEEGVIDWEGGGGGEEFVRLKKVGG